VRRPWFNHPLSQLLYFDERVGFLPSRWRHLDLPSVLIVNEFSELALQCLSCPYPHPVEAPDPFLKLQDSRLDQHGEVILVSPLHRVVLVDALLHTPTKICAKVFWHTVVVWKLARFVMHFRSKSFWSNEADRPLSLVQMLPFILSKAEATSLPAPLSGIWVC